MPEVVIPRSGNIVPKARAPALEGALAQPNHGIWPANELTAKLNHLLGAGYFAPDAELLLRRWL